ncbi:hypothetical protein K439DRAFT_1622707 [Ramaria rubella]|nr:hypothetical protein K439DRAFT_1622707 [Ramaria rubella]
MVHLDEKDSARSPGRPTMQLWPSYRRDRWMRVHPGAYRRETRSPEHRTAPDRHPGPRDGMIGYDWIRDDRYMGLISRFLPPSSLWLLHLSPGRPLNGLWGAVRVMSVAVAPGG